VVVSPIAARLSSLIPTFLAPLLSIVATFLATLAACVSCRPPIFKRRVAKRLTRLRLLATHATRPGYCKNHQNK
jgi:hypothetical protein